MKETSRGSNFTKHWVRIRVDGFRPERLLSQAAKAGICLRNICWRDETEVCFTVPKSQYVKLKKMAKSKYRLTVIREGGVMAVVKQIKSTPLFVVGVLLAVSFYFLQLGFVKEVNVLGCETIPEDQLREVLAEEGLYEGAVKTFDCDKIEKRLFQAYPEVVWAKVSYQGRYVQVEIAEGDLQEEAVPDRSQPCDIVAEVDGYIEKIYTYMGRTMVKEGDFVRKGDILIAGTVPIERPTYPVDEDTPMYHYVHAEGEVTARIPRYVSFTMEPDRSEAEIRSEIRAWIKKNVPENAEILNKDFHFDTKKNIIKVYGMIETRQPVGVEKEISIDERQNAGNEETSD